MEIVRRDNEKLIEVWLTNAEKNDPGIRESLKLLYKKYHLQQFTVAVFESGTESLYEGTKQLITQHINLS